MLLLSSLRAVEVLPSLLTRSAGALGGRSFLDESFPLQLWGIEGLLGEIREGMRDRGAVGPWISPVSLVQFTGSCCSGVLISVENSDQIEGSLLIPFGKIPFSKIHIPYGMRNQSGAMRGAICGIEQARSTFIQSGVGSSAGY